MKENREDKLCICEDLPHIPHMHQNGEIRKPLHPKKFKMPSLSKLHLALTILTAIGFMVMGWLYINLSHEETFLMQSLVKTNTLVISTAEAVANLNQ